jgi:glycosyltransferase involved in cell wall biosynthesis
MDSNKRSQPHTKTHIAILGTFPPLRGLSSYCLAFSLALAELVGVEFISFKKLYPGFLYPGGGLAEDHSFPETTHRDLKVRRRLTWYNPITWLTEAVFSKTDLFHAQWWSLPLAAIYACMGAIFKLRNKPVVFTVHNVLSHERSRLYQLVSSWLFKLGDHFIVHTKKNGRQVEERHGISRDCISIIPHGSLDFHVKNHVNRDRIRQEFGLDPGDKVVLLFGAIRPYKGVDTALKAFARVLTEVPDARLMVAGKLWQKWEPSQKLMNTLAIGNSVKTFLEYIPAGEVYKYFEAADLVILPYHHFDSQSGIGATAVSFRKPMIVSDVGGLPDLVKNGRYVIPPKDPEALARCMIECLQDKSRLAEMAADAGIVAAEISWSSIAQKTCAIYHNLLEAQKKDPIRIRRL